VKRERPKPFRRTWGLANDAVVQGKLMSFRFCIGGTRRLDGKYSRSLEMGQSQPGTASVDGVSIERFPKWGRPRWKQTQRQLLEGRYVPQPVRRIEIPKESGGVHRLGIPGVLDRVANRAKSQHRLVRESSVLGFEIHHKKLRALDAHFEQIGLVSLRALGCKIHHPATAR
jgi:hypothetical protein